MSKNRWDPSGMPEGAARAEIEYGIRQTMRGVLQDAFNGISKSASVMPPAREEQRPVSGGGTMPITSPPGLDLIDKMLAQQDRKDRLAAIQQATENARVAFRKGAAD